MRTREDSQTVAKNMAKRVRLKGSVRPKGSGQKGPFRSRGPAGKPSPVLSHGTALQDVLGRSPRRSIGVPAGHAQGGVSMGRKSL